MQDKKYSNEEVREALYALMDIERKLPVKSSTGILILEKSGLITESCELTAKGHQALEWGFELFEKYMLEK